MKLSPSTLLALSAATLIPSALVAQDSAIEAISELEAQKVTALESYLEANPEAEDRGQALALLIDSNALLGNDAEVAVLLRQRYDGMSKGPDAELEQMIGGVVVPLVQIHTRLGQKDQALELLDTLEKDLASHPAAPQLGQFMAQMRGQLNQPQVGDTMDISFTSVAGKEIDLAAMKGKVVLVDFWATWCGPCIAEMPTVTATYEELHEDGFEVVGISLDEKQADLDKFVTDYKMPWPQYFDGKGWENELAKKFGIQSIPATFLIGKDGKIVGSNLRGPALGEAVKAALAAE